MIMSEHSRTVVVTYFICDECGEECGNGFRTRRVVSGPDMHACSKPCEAAQDEKVIAEVLAARRARREQEGGGS